MDDNSFILDNLLQQVEGLRLEFKAIPNKEAIAKTITGFINMQGGDLVIGVEDDKKLIGVVNAEKERAGIQKMLVEQIKPSAPISTQVIHYKSKDFILISVWEGAKKPYQFKNKIYSRENDMTKASTIIGLNLLIKERKNADFQWERRTVLATSIDDLDLEEINETISYYNKYRSNRNTENIEDFLIQMGLIQNGSLTNACMVLFAKNPTKYIPQSKIRITVYPSEITGDNFLNDKIFDGNIFKNITAILNFIEISFGKSIVVDGVLRKEKYNYPLLAIREGLLNAMVHRDYNSVNGFLKISIYSDRTEISNYGGLPVGITIKNLKKEHNSVLRNPDIAQICFLRKYIEMLGSGTLRMINDCKENGYRIPAWKDKDDITTVIFPDLYIKSKNNEGVSEGVSEGVNEGVNEGVKNWLFEGVSEGVNQDLGQILTLIRDRNGIRVPEIAYTLGKSVSTTERYLKILREKALIKFEGAPRIGGYYLKTDK
jgi:ATP-dependent DNA helicase RecG